MAAAHFIYADEMTSLMYGYPLWEPECRPEVSIADVGYIRHGRFHRLFNASLPRGHPQNEFGVPEGYEPLNIDERAMVERRLPPGVMMSQSVSKRGAEMEISGSVLEAGAGFEFSCKKNRGAVLIINSEARRKDSEQRGAFKKYMLKHYKSWWAFANNEPHYRDILLSDLVFVSGRDNTADWAVAAFSEHSTSGGVFFEAGYPTIAGAKFSIWGSWKGIRSIHSNCGPQIPTTSAEDIAFPQGAGGPVCAADLQAYNQCVFIRGFRVLDRTGQVRQKIGLKVPGNTGGLEHLQKPWFSRNSSGNLNDTDSVKKDRSSDGGSWGKKHTQSESVSTMDQGGDPKCVEIVSNELEMPAPVESVLAYILETSEASVGIVHDDDLATIIKNNHDSLDFASLLSKVVPQVEVDSEGVGTLLSENIICDSPTSRSVSPTRSVLPPSGQQKPGYPFNSGTEPKQPLRRSHRMSDANHRGFENTAYTEEQESIKAEINALQVQLASVQDKISLTSKNGRGADRQNTLRVELDSLRNQQLAEKVSHGATMVELKKVQEDIRTKIKNLQGIAKKLPAKTLDDIESQIQTLDRRVTTGTLSLSEEKKVVGQINNLRRCRTAVERYQALQASVGMDRCRVSELHKQLDSRSKALPERVNTVHAELDALKKEREEAFANRGNLYSERDSLAKELSALHEKRRRSTEQFREKREMYLQQVYEERAKEAERRRAERSAQEEQRRAEARERLLEKARVPAFKAEIQDCRSLLEFFSSKVDHSSSATVATAADGEQRSKRETSPPLRGNYPGAGWVPVKKKAEKDYFVGGKSKAKKGQRRGPPSAAITSSKVSIPLGIMTTLLSLGVTPPATTTEVTKTLEDLHQKIEWFEANQTRVTEENVTRTEAEFERIGHIANMRSVSVST